MFRSANVKHGNYRSLIASAAFPGLLALFPLLLARKILQDALAQLPISPEFRIQFWEFRKDRYLIGWPQTATAGFLGFRW